MSKVSCGIDFGTTNSAISIACADSSPRLVPLAHGKETIPTAIFYPSEQGLSPIFGYSAVSAYIEGEKGRFMRSMKRILGSDLMSGGTRINGISVRFEEIIAAFISQLKQQAENNIGATIDDVIMGRPVHFRDNDPAGDARAEKELEQIARSIGFKNIGFQFEPIAAAYAHEAKLEAEKLACVVDIGGGTSDFTIIKIGPKLMHQIDRSRDILASTGVRIGGNDFDKDLCLKSFMPAFGYGSQTKPQSSADKVLPLPSIPYFTLSEWSKVNSMYTPKEVNFIKKMLFHAEDVAKVSRLLELVEEETGHTLLNAVEQTKISLTEHDLIKQRLDFISDKPEITAGRAEFEDSMQRDIVKISASVNDCLKQAQTKADDIELIILTGGSTEIPLVQQTALNLFPNAAISQEDKLSSVGLGLAFDSRRRF